MDRSVVKAKEDLRFLLLRQKLQPRVAEIEMRSRYSAQRPWDSESVQAPAAHHASGKPPPSAPK